MSVIEMDVNYRPGSIVRNIQTDELAIVSTFIEGRLFGVPSGKNEAVELMTARDAIAIWTVIGHIGVNDSLMAELRQAREDKDAAVAEFRERHAEFTKIVADTQEKTTREVQDALGRVAAMSKDLADERKTANELRDKLMNLTVENAEMRGYLQGVEDSEPPRMVPEMRERRGWAREQAAEWIAPPRFGDPGRAWYHR